MNARILPLAIAALITLGACGGGDSDGSPDTASGTTESAADASVAPTEPDDSSGDAAGSEAANGGAAGSDEGATVTIDRSRFDNTELRVAVGTTVTFVNNDPFAHTVTSRDDSAIEFDSGEIGEGETFEFTFGEAGEFAYFCQIHPTMRAVVIVE